MGMAQRIKTAAAYKGISQAKIAEAIGMTPSNFSQKLRRETFTEDELRQIADVLGCTFEPFAFRFDDGMKI